MYLNLCSFSYRNLIVVVSLKESTKNLQFKRTTLIKGFKASLLEAT